MNIQPYRYILGALLMLAGLPVMAQDTLQLAEAIQLGLENNFDIRIVRNSVEIAENNYSYRNAGFLPTLSADGALTKEVQDTQQSFLDGREQNANNAASTNLGASATLDWTIFDGTRMFIAYEQVGALRKAEATNAEVTIENTIAQISNAFYSVILEKAQMEVFEESLELSQERVDIAKTKYEVGRVSKLEYLAAQVDYNEDKSALILQQEALYTAKVTLNNLINQPPDAAFEVPGQIDPNLALDKEVLRNLVLESNPNLLLAWHNQNLAYLEMKAQKTDYYPNISLNAGYGYNSLEAEAGFVFLRRSNGPFYGVTGTWTIFDRFNRRREVQNAQVQVETTELEIERIRQSLLADLESTYINYLNNVNLFQLEEQNLEIARENAEIALERYRLGNSNALELREAQNNAVQAESRLINAIYSTKLAEIELMRLSGRMLSNR
jgi:outer membrane protein